MITAIGHSANPVMSFAAKEIIEQCVETFKDDDLQPDLGFIFTSRMGVDYGILLDNITGQWPGIQLAGCTTDGEISDLHPCTEDSFSLLLIKSEHIKFSVGAGQGLSTDPDAAVRSAMAQIGPAPEQGFAMGIVLAEGIKTFGVSVDGALRRVLGDKMPIIGGFSGDHMLFKQTCLFYNNRVLKDSIIIIMVSGRVGFSMQLESGYKPIGPRHAVDSYHANVVHKIDGISAVDYYRHYINGDVTDVALFPLAVYDDSGRFVLRDPIELNQEDGSIRFCGIFPENAVVRMTVSDRKSILRHSRLAVQNALKKYPGESPDLAMLFPCTSRRHILGLQASDEHSALQEYKKTNPGMRFFGMYGYGELGPAEDTGPVCFQNDTYAVLLLGEDYG